MRFFGHFEIRQALHVFDACVYIMYVDFVLCLCGDCFCGLTFRESVLYVIYIWEGFWNMHLLMPVVIILRWPFMVVQLLLLARVTACKVWLPLQWNPTFKGHPELWNKGGLKRWFWKKKKKAVLSTWSVFFFCLFPWQWNHKVEGFWKSTLKRGMVFDKRLHSLCVLEIHKVYNWISNCYHCNLMPVTVHSCWVL